MDSQDELNASTFQTYVYLVRIGKPAGLRDVMRGANFSSPSVAYRNLQKLIDLGLIIKDTYGNYVVKKNWFKRARLDWQSFGSALFGVWLDFCGFFDC